jgi:UDP-3-O-[3-hydroxymyristoyl] glucosamine N-acyltransferase
MIDPRFYDLLGPKTLNELAQIVGGTLTDAKAGDRKIETCGSLADVGANGLAFYQRPKGSPNGNSLIATRAGACLVTQGSVGVLPDGIAGIIVSSPRAAFAILAGHLVARKEVAISGPLIDPSAKIEEGARLGHNVIVGAGAEIGTGTYIGPNTVIGPGVAIGRNCRIGANVVVYCTYIGDHVTINSNSVIGESGFGVEVTPDGPIDVLQLGRVILQDNVSIGSLCAVDRGAFEDTIVGLGSKIDNFTQIAHNCKLGRGVIIAAFGGISGSCEIGDGVMMGGRVGVADHTKVGDGATIMAAAGVFRDIPAKENWGGVPAQPVRQWHREVIALKKLVKTKST